MIDETHSVARRSWVASANGHADFPIQNLPLGVFTPGSGAARGGVAIGDDIFDLAAALDLGLFDAQVVPAAASPSMPAAVPAVAATGTRQAGSNPIKPATVVAPAATSAPAPRKS